jgi:hypothetical protein
MARRAFRAASGALRRPFSMFPGGLPGLALVLLRISATATSIFSVYGSYYDRPVGYLWALIPLGAALCVGFLTPFVAVLIVTIQMFGFNSWSTNIVWLGASMLNTFALALIGPGAYSLDALRFGRRLLMSNRRD